MIDPKDVREGLRVQVVDDLLIKDHQHPQGFRIPRGIGGKVLADYGRGGVVVLWYFASGEGLTTATLTPAPELPDLLARIQELP